MKDTPTREEAFEKVWQTNSGILVEAETLADIMAADKDDALSIFSAGESFARETLAKSIIAMGLPTGHGDTIEDLCAELRTEWEELRSRYTEQGRREVMDRVNNLDWNTLTTLHMEQTRDLPFDSDGPVLCELVLSAIAAKLKGEGV